jgi:hypothetical protein
VREGFTTIITPIGRSGEHVAALEHFLRTEVEPLYDPDAILKCKSGFAFDQIGSLHFCSFTVLKGDAEFPPYLVFEATFDGPRDFFLDALLNVAPGAIDEIYRHCEGYPETGLAVPQLIKDYLADHDVGAQTFFRGSPGRTVAEIKGEATIYDALVNFVSDRWRGQSPNTRWVMPATYAGFQEELQRVIRDQPANRWAEQMAAVPWEVAGRNAVAAAAVLAALGAAGVLGAVFLGLFGLGPFHVNANWQKYVSEWGKWLFGEGNYGMRTSLPLLALILVWGVLRLVELLLSDEDPRKAHFPLRYFIHILIIVRYFALALHVGFAALLVNPEPTKSPDPTFTMWLESTHPSTVDVGLLMLGAISVFVLLQHIATSLKLEVQFQELKLRRENFRRWQVDVLRFLMVLVGVFALFVVFSYLPHGLSARAGDILLPLMETLLVAAIYVFVGLIIAYVIGGVLFLAVRMMERADCKRFKSSDELTVVDNSAVYAREEGGINTYQNHLVSLTYVKPGIARYWFLRLTLFFVGLLSRFWFNIGELGGIPAILSARWVLFDGGKRLLFLDHYGGAWDSYLNEFIDLDAVLGLNAIWTNTFIKAGGAGTPLPQGEYGFPETEYYFWKGAQVERPLKAYVRQSQVETLVWYSAYPKPATININTNTNVRQSLFKTLTSCEIDSLFGKL